MADIVESEATPAASNVASPEQRPDSPSPSVSPSRALDAVPLLARSVSTPSNSSVSEWSTYSRQSRVSDGGTAVVKRRGYMRPQGTAFADSARNRDSIMSLGSIAHMQYYFARTGLLDGKGAQLAKQRDMKKITIGNKENMQPRCFSGSAIDDFNMSTLSLQDSNSLYSASESGNDQSMVSSPTELIENGDHWNTSTEPMLPPTVSTYKQKPSYTEPLPDMPVLRRELKEALQDACKVLEETQKSNHDSPSSEESNGFYEIQGLHLLDIITLAIRAAKNYYTAYTSPAKLYSLRSSRDLRRDLYKVLDVLKMMAARNFRGGMRMTELTDILLWIERLDKLLKREEEWEVEEAAEREAWAWLEGDWTGREREREWLFLKAFDAGTQSLPQWPESSDDLSLPNDFLKALQDGQRLVKLHNVFVSRSKRKFGEIKTWHSDVAKPYRMAENLRFWIKASELRWEVKLSVPVSDLVNDKNEDAWMQFDRSILTWCQGVRAELMEGWRHEAATERKEPPKLKIELPFESANGGKYHERNESNVTIKALPAANSTVTNEKNDSIEVVREWTDYEDESVVI